MLSMTPKSRCTTTTSPELRVGKYLPTPLVESIGRTILDISTLLKMLPDCRPLCFRPGKVTKFIISFGRIEDLAPPSMLGGRLVVSGMIYWSQCVEGSIVVCRVYIGC